MRARLGLLLFALSLSWAPGWARGETPPAAATESGKEEFDRGRRYFEAEEYEMALPFFQKAYVLSGKRASTIRSLAQCERALKLYDSALAHFQEYLATAPTDAAAVRETIALLEAQREKQRAEEAEKRAKEEAERREQARLEAERKAQHEAEVQRLREEAEAQKAEAERNQRAAERAREEAERARKDNERSKELQAQGGLLSSPLFWIGTAVLVAGGAAAAIYFTQRPEVNGGTTGFTFDL